MAKKEAVKNEDLSVEENTVESVVDVDVNEMSIEELKAALLAQRQELIAAKAAATKPRRPAAPVLSPEEQAELDEKIAAAKLKVSQAEEVLKAAKQELHALQPKAVGLVQRGPSGVGAFIKNLINEGLNNEDILKAVVAEFPNNFTNNNCINWYRNAIKKYGPEGKRPSSKSSSASVTPLKDDGSFEAALEEAQTGEIPEGMPE